jgi:hypothetical protein
LLRNPGCATGPGCTPRAGFPDQYARARETEAAHGVVPRGPVKGMLAAQMVATHDAAMECHRRASHPGQTAAGRDTALAQAGKLVRSCAALVEALGRHRGKGQPQVVRVERVTVEAGGQAIAGTVGQGGGGAARPGEQPHAKQLAHAPEPALRGADPGREPVPVAGGERQAAAPDARRRAGGGARAGHRNALEHGSYSREVLRLRRAVRDLLRGSAAKRELVRAKRSLGRVASARETLPPTA